MILQLTRTSTKLKFLTKIIFSDYAIFVYHLGQHELEISLEKRPVLVYSRFVLPDYLLIPYLRSQKSTWYSVHPFLFPSSDSEMIAPDTDHGSCLSFQTIKL